MAEKNFIPLTDDILFKETFGREKNIYFLERLLEQYYGLKIGTLKGKIVSKMDFREREILR